MLFVGKESSSPIPADTATVDTTTTGDVDDEKGAVAETLNMVVEKIDVLIDKALCMKPEDEDERTGSNDPDLSDVVERPGMERPNRDLYMTTECGMFPALAFSDDEDGG